MRKPTSIDVLLRTVVNRISYDVTKRTVEIYMPRYHSCGMDGAIKLFERIDPDVEVIIAYGGEDGSEVDIAYVKQDGQWRAHCMRHTWAGRKRFLARQAAAAESRPT